MLTYYGLGNFVAPEILLASECLRSGDLLEIDRKIYSHWAVYVGNEYVVHVTTPKSEIPSTEAYVLKEKLVDVTGDSLVRVNNKVVPAKERGLTPRPNDQIVASALKMIGQRVPHNLLTRNVEHYVTEWVYGIGWSDQAQIALETMTILPSPIVEPEKAHQALLNGLTMLLDSPGVDSSNSLSVCEEQ